MALGPHPLKLLAPYLKGADVLSLGYPDLLIPKEMVRKLFGYEPQRFNRAPQHGKDFGLPETREFMERVVKSFDCVDVAQIQGTERIVDLNYPHDLGAFDLVIDPGTTEHCFNVAQALINAAQSVRDGGRIAHVSPVTMVNHGFWNFCPTVYHDFYGQNGWTVEHFELYRSHNGMEYVAPLKGREIKRHVIEPENGLICIAKRNGTNPMRYPYQSKYAAMLAKAAA